MQMMKTNRDIRPYIQQCINEYPTDRLQNVFMKAKQMGIPDSVLLQVQNMNNN